MAITVIPKDNPAGHRKPAWEVTSLPRRDGSLIGPELPAFREWKPVTLEWWDMWRRHEIAPFLEPSDWSHLRNVAVLVDLYWSDNVKPSSKVAIHAEIRRCEAGYGATVLDRLKMRLRFVEPSEAPSDGPALKVDYSDLLDDE